MLHAHVHAQAQAHADKLPDALGQTRRGRPVAQVSGDLSEELEAIDLQEMSWSP